MDFRNWLLEVGGTGGVGGGLTPNKENPTTYAGSFSDYHDEKSSDPKNPNGVLPPLKKKQSKVYKPNGRRN